MQPAFQVLPATGSPRAGNTSRRKIGASFPRAPIPLHSQLRPWFPPAALHTHTHTHNAHAQRTANSAGCWAHSHLSLLWPLAAPATHCTLYNPLWADLSMKKKSIKSSMIFFKSLPSSFLSQIALLKIIFALLSVGFCHHSFFSSHFFFYSSPSSLLICKHYNCSRLSWIALVDI